MCINVFIVVPMIIMVFCQLWRCFISMRCTIKSDTTIIYAFISIHTSGYIQPVNPNTDIDKFYHTFNKPKQKLYRLFDRTNHMLKVAGDVTRLYHLTVQFWVINIIMNERKKFYMNSEPNCLGRFCIEEYYKTINSIINKNVKFVYYNNILQVTEAFWSGNRGFVSRTRSGAGADLIERCNSAVQRSLTRVPTVTLTINHVLTAPWFCY